MFVEWNRSTVTVVNGLVVALVLTLSPYFCGQSVVAQTLDKSAPQPTEKTQLPAKPKTDQSNQVADPLLQPIPIDTEELPLEEQSKLVRDIYHSTKTATSIKASSNLIQKCDAANAKALNAKNRAYVASIKGWALNRRGELRLEQAKQYKSLGSVDRFQESFKVALEDFDISLLHDSKRHRSWNARGIAHVVNENWASAIADFTESTKLKPDFVAGWFNRAEANYHAGQFEAAFNDYQTVLRFDADDCEALTGRGLCHLALKQFSKALEDFQFVQSRHPDQSSVDVNFGDTFLTWGKWEKAKEKYQQAIEKGKANPVSKNDLRIAKQRLAWMLATCPNQQLAKPDEALKLITSVIQEDGQSIKRLETLAAAEAALGKFESAAKNQKNAIRLVEFESDDVENDTKVRLTLYERGKSYQLHKPETVTSKQGADVADGDQSK